MKKSPEELYAEREKRVQDAIALREPDRAPFLPFCHFFPAEYAGFSKEEAMHDYEKLAMAWQKFVEDFDPDMYNSPFANVGIGNLLRILDCRQLEWPGGSLPSDRPFQFVEKEYMTAEEYDDFLFDPTDYIHRVFLPRVFGALKPLASLPPTPSMIYLRFLTGTAVLARTEIGGALQSLLAAASEAHKMLSRAAAFSRDMKALGFPPQFGATAFAPFDYFGDLLRGTRGIMLDMFRCPEKLLAAIDRMYVYTLRGILDNVKASGVPSVFIPLHKCIDVFMSPAQFERFYWPSLRRLTVELIRQGITPTLFWEGKCDSRLTAIGDIPKGKAVYWFEGTDLFRAKEILGDTVCIRGNVPASMQCTASPQEVTDYCRRLIEVVGKGGGFILDGGAGIPDEARPENVRAMADAVRQYS
ncbi:MAG: uroporphyrinogen decarboxylase family protein [Thermodesulfobacteriota bacterium]